MKNQLDLSFNLTYFRVKVSWRCAMIVPVAEVVTAYPVPFPVFTSRRKGYARAVVFRSGSRFVAVMSDGEKDLKTLPVDENRLYLTNSVEHFASFLLWTLRQTEWNLKPEDVVFVQYVPPVEPFEKGTYSVVEFKEVKEISGNWGWSFAKPRWTDFLTVPDRSDTTDEEAAKKALELVGGER